LALAWPSPTVSSSELAIMATIIRRDIRCFSLPP
jgi:hypothetical protein